MSIFSFSLRYGLTTMCRGWNFLHYYGYFNGGQLITLSAYQEEAIMSEGWWTMDNSF